LHFSALRGIGLRCTSSSGLEGRRASCDIEGSKLWTRTNQGNQTDIR